MATQTTNLGLTLPIGSEKVSRQIINQNNQLIDDFAGQTTSNFTTVNTAIGNINSDNNSTTDILASALNCTKTTFFNGAGGSYTGTLPPKAPITFKWSTFMVNVKDTIKTVIAHSPGNVIYTNTYDNGAWAGWREVISNGTTVSYHGNVTFNSSGVGTVTVVGALYGKPVFVTLDTSNPTSLTVAATVSTTDTVTITAYNTDTKAAYSGTRAVNVLVVNS